MILGLRSLILKTKKTLTKGRVYKYKDGILRLMIVTDEQFFVLRIQTLSYLHDLEDTLD